jgi:hypothetical protein
MWWFASSVFIERRTEGPIVLAILQRRQPPGVSVKRIFVPKEMTDAEEFVVCFRRFLNARRNPNDTASRPKGPNPPSSAVRHWPGPARFTYP